MLRDIQIDHLRREVTHVDLLAIDIEKDLEVEVPIRFTGKAKGTIEGGQIHVDRHSVAVMCKPRDIPGEFVMDIAEMMIGDVRHVGELIMPEGVRAATSSTLPIVTVVAPKADKVEEEVPAEAAAAEEEAPADEAAGEEGAKAAPAAEGDRKEGDRKAGDKKAGDKKK
jgi:large subunit ribosomal protein L25